MTACGKTWLIRGAFAVLKFSFAAMPEFEK